jgi:hypothetical protein
MWLVSAWISGRDVVRGLNRDSETVLGRAAVLRLGTIAVLAGENGVVGLVQWSTGMGEMSCH